MISNASENKMFKVRQEVGGFGGAHVETVVVVETKAGEEIPAGAEPVAEKPAPVQAPKDIEPAAPSSEDKPAAMATEDSEAPA